MPSIEQVQAALGFLLGPFGLTVGLLALVWALYTERLVAGPTARRWREERDAALRRLDRAITVSGRAVDLADTKEK